jgi:hypothetical protein
MFLGYGKEFLFGALRGDKMRKFILTVLCACAITAFAAYLAGAADMPSSKIKLSIPGSAQKSPVLFDHPGHVKAMHNDCKACHHAVEGSGGPARCSSCHTAEGKGSAMRGRSAFHKMCNDCHKKMSVGPHYPKDCRTCHAGGPAFPYVNDM